MSEPAKQFDGNSDPSLSNAGVIRTSAAPSFRNPVPSTSVVNTNFAPPALPPRPDNNMQNNYGMNTGYNYGGMGGSYGMGYGGYGYNTYGGGYGMGMGMGGMNSYGGFNRFGNMYGDIESRFIQMAEENSRPAFDSIQSVVNAVGSVAMMLDNTFFALTSSFRAILGVAENFGRLRSLFAQFWSTFAVVRSLNWLVRKLLVLLGIRTENEFKAWAEAVAATQTDSATPEQRAKGSSWPVLLFFGVIAAAPYIVLKMLNGISSCIHERLQDPKTWQNPLRAVAQHDFQATSSQEISFNANQVLTVAPQHLQGHLWNSGWLMATTDNQTAGMIPVNYIKVIRPMNQTDKANNEITNNENTHLPYMDIANTNMPNTNIADRNMANTNIANTIITDTNIANANNSFKNNASMNNGNANNSITNNADINNTDTNIVNAINSNANNADINSVNTNIANAIISNANNADINSVNTNVPSAIISNANNTEINSVNTNVASAIISNANNADISYANTNDANTNIVNANNSNINNVDITNASPSNSNTNNADIINANTNYVNINNKPTDNPEQCTAELEKYYGQEL